MTTDWKALCAELLEDVRYLIDAVCDGEHDPVALRECAEDRDRARAALSQPEAVGPTDEELNDLYWATVTTHPVRENIAVHIAGLRAVLARWGHH